MGEVKPGQQKDNDKIREYLIKNRQQWVKWNQISKRIMIKLENIFRYPKQIR